MSLIATDVLKPAFDKTKKLLLPFKFWIWIKLGLLAILAGGISSGGSNFNYSFPGGSNPGLESLNLSSVLSNLPLWIIGIAIFSVIFVVVILLIKSFFTFGFIKSIDTEKVFVLKHLRSVSNLGASYFWVNLLMTIILLAIIAAFIIPIILFVGISNLTANFSSIPLLIGLFFLFMLVAFIFALVYAFIDSFVVYFMYLNKKKSWFSIKACWRLFIKNFKEMFLFWLIKVGLNIAGVFILLFVMLFVLVLLFLVGAVLAGIVYALYLAVGLIGAIILGVIFGIAFLLLLFTVILLLSAPVSAFIITFNLLFMKKFLLKAKK